MIKYIYKYLGMAQLVARSVRDAEVVSSSLITQTILWVCQRQGLAQLVARTPGGREVASSSLVALTIFLFYIYTFF